MFAFANNSGMKLWVEHTTIVFLLLIGGGGWLIAQSNSDRSPNDKQGQITVRGVRQPVEW
jgi:hypothetical protein